jgi:hypothetical protein
MNDLFRWLAEQPPTQNLIGVSFTAYSLAQLSTVVGACELAGVIFTAITDPDRPGVSVVFAKGSLAQLQECVRLAGMP